MIAALHPFERRPVIPGVLDLTYVQNPYGAMGLFGDRPALLIGLALGVVVLLAYLLRETLRHSVPAQLGFGLVVGGAAGNVIDRFVHHFVVDFIAPRGFYIFNAGDAFITVGVVTIVFAGLRSAPRTRTS